MIKRLLLAALFSIAAVPAFAACSSPVTVKDGGGSNVSMSMATGADGNCQSKIDIDTSSQLHLDMTAAVPGMPATAYNTNTYTNGTASPVNMDLNGGWYVNLSRYMGTAGTANAGVLSVQGIAAMTPFLTNPGTAANWGVVATGAAPPANAIYLGTNQSGATGGHVGGLVSCDNHVFKHITSATDTVAVQGVASQTIYICAWRSRAAGVATWYLENTASANNNCSSTLTQINGVATEAANTGETFSSPFWHGLKNTSGHGLCINSTGTGGVDVDIWYTQF